VITLGQPLGGSRSILRRSVATQFAGRRAVIVRDGVQTPVPFRVDVGAGDFALGRFTVAVPTRASKLTLPTILGRGFVPRRSDAASRVYTYGEGASDPDLLLPGRPLDVRPDRVAEPHVRPGGFVVRHALPMILRSSAARDHVYESLRLYDPALSRPAGPVRPGGWILGRSKLRQKPFTIRLSVDASRRRPGGFVLGRCLPMAPRPFDEAHTDEIFAAARAAKLGRDRVLIRFGLHRPIQAGDNLPADGGYRLGQIIRSL
jgi:hypothetical protein